MVKDVVQLPISLTNDLIASVGIAASDRVYVDYIIGHEGHWDPCVRNGNIHDCSYRGPKSYGICQSMPGKKMASMGADWATNVSTQLRWCDQYAHAVYHSWAQAYQHWLRFKSW